MAGADDELGYDGLRPLAFDVPLIEIEPLAGGLVDLYNQCRLEGATVTGAELAFDFRTLDGEPVRLAFSGVEGLTLGEPEDWDPREGDQIEHLLVRPPGDWNRFEFQAGGRVWSFNAQRVSFRRN